MKLDELDFLPLKVMHVGPKGKRTFDPQGKRKLIEVCRRSGASVASLALKAGVNANQLRNWMALDEAHHATTAITSAMPIAPMAFVPVVEIGALQPLPMSRQSEPVTPVPSPPLARLAAQFPNGVTVELACTGRDGALVAAMIKALRTA